ncbi:MAG: hypothetical protein LBL66_02965 [Clostridiales bacterium]|nr:hypothetical protein [Clostridiales bacterium]
MGDFSTTLEMTYMRIRNDRALRGGAFVCLVEIASLLTAFAPRNDRRGVRVARNDEGSAQCTVSVGDVCARGVRVLGRDCRVALRAPRNDMRGVCASRNDRRGVRAPRHAGSLRFSQ